MRTNVGGADDEVSGVQRPYWPFTSASPPDPPEWADCLQNEWNQRENALNQCEDRTIQQCHTRMATQQTSAKSGFSTTNRVVACGDIHGDYNLLKRILIMNRLAVYDDETSGGKGWTWVAYDATLVFLGDLVDALRSEARCVTGAELDEVEYSEWKIYMLLATLYNQGADIITLWGNHETWLIKNIYTNQYRTALAKAQDRRRAEHTQRLWSPPDGVYWRLMTMCNGGGRVIVRINNWIFMHGGINRSWLTRFILTEEDRTNMAAGSASDQFGDAILEKVNAFYMQEMISKSHPFSTEDGSEDITWTRTQSSPETSDGDVCDTLLQLLSELYSRPDMRICVGHCTNYEDGLFQTPKKTSYVMTNDVTGLYPTDDLSGHVKKLSLPASRCWYDQSWVERSGKAPLGDRCPPIPGVTFACVPVDGRYMHNAEACPASDCRGQTTERLGRVFRIDCGMARGFRYNEDWKDLKYIRPVLAKHPNMDEASFRRYLTDKMLAAQTAQTLEIIRPESEDQEETVNHVIALENVDQLFDEHAFDLQ